MNNDLLQFLLKILLIIGSSIKGAFRQIQDVHSGYLTTLRNLRASSITILEKFFKNFDKYPWTNDEIHSIFDTFIWPYLDKLCIEGIHSPTALLKLVSVWGANPRYFQFLIKYDGKNTEEYVLSHVIKLFANNKIHGSVSACIKEMLKNLLNLEESEEDLEIKLNIDQIRPLDQNIKDRLDLNEKINFGSCILLPHVSSILNKLQENLKSKKKTINQSDLFILSRISELVWEPEISDSVLHLLLPIILKRCSVNAREEVVLDYMNTLYNLMKKVNEPQNHIKQVSALFADVMYPGSRKILCQVLQVIADKLSEPLKSEINTASKLINELNAWDPKWIDQPDFQRRIDAFKQIEGIIESGTISVELGILVIFNCYYLIQNEKDLSLRENATHCWKGVAVSLIKVSLNSHKTLDYILNNTLLNLIRHGLGNKNEDVRNECISLLGHLARECASAHIMLQDLNKLTNKIDLEVDFFENLVHLQKHRHARALVKFVQIYKNEEKPPNTRTLTQFILPLTSHYLLNEKYANKNSLIDAAIDTIGLASKLLPWHQYEGLLKYYLDKLRFKIEYQRQLVRLIVTILDGFHFNLSKGDVQFNASKKGETVENKQVENVEEEKDSNIDADETKEELNLDAILNGVEESEMDVDDEEKSVVLVKACEKVSLMCRSSANRIIKTIQVVLLPQLHKSLAMLTQHDSSHKVNRKKTAIEREEQDLLKVPISLAVVKLLQRLPKEILDSNLPGIFMKMCTFLKSQLESVRRVARETLQKIMLTLGPQYLPLLIGEMTPLMSRGYQVHVLVYTVHAVLVCLKDSYKPGDIDAILLTVLSLCQTDLFGSVAEEKEVAKIGTKVSEAKSSKSVDIFLILAQYITDSCLMDLILPLKEILTNTHSYKTVNKVQECLRQVALGLVSNTFVKTESLVKFSYGISSESIPQFILGKNKPELTEKEREKLQRQKEDCFIIPKAPVGKAGIRINNVKTSLKTNAHVIVEFGLRLCYFILKRDKIKDEDVQSLIDPFVDIFKKCLYSNHTKLSTIALQCLTWILKYDLPSMKENIKDIIEVIFKILHKYAAAGLSKGDNFDLVVAAFKTMSVIVRDVKFYTVTTDQLKILLLYVEQDLYDMERQSIAFNLLKAIISRKLITPEIFQVMDKVAELSITSELDHVRTQSRLVFHQFIMDYPLGKQLDKHVAFFVSQLSYEMQTGRESALDMIQSLIHSFPLNILKEHSGTFLVTLGARLINDEVPHCRKLVSNCIKLLFNKLPQPNRDALYDIIALWMKDNKVQHKHMGCQLCGIMVLVEQSNFEARIPSLMPILLSQFDINQTDSMPGQFVKLKESEEINEEKERCKDHHLFQAIQMCLKISSNCPSFLKRTDDMEKLGNYMQMLLAYPHEWVRMAAAQFLGFLLSSLNIDTLAKLICSNEKDKTGYLYSDPINGVKSLALDLCAQLQPGSINNEFAEQVVKNLVFVARVLANIQFEKEDDCAVNLLWLTKRIRKVVNREVVECPSSTVLRMEVFKWIGAVVSVLNSENILPVVFHLLAPLVREMITTEEANAPLRQLSKEVATVVKKKIGLEKYTEVLSKLEQHLLTKRAERKRTKTQLAVTNPEVHAKSKIRRQEKKKESKKRKIAELKGNKRKSVKRRKVLDMELDSSEII